MSMLQWTNCGLATPAFTKTESALRCSKEQQELAAERAAVKGERAVLDRMRDEFETELQQARGEMQRAQDALQGGQQRGAPSPGCACTLWSKYSATGRCHAGQSNQSAVLILH